MSTRPTPSPSPTPTLRALQVVVAAVTAGILVMGLAFAFVLDLGAPPPAAALLLLLLGAGLHLVLERVGYRTSALPPGTPSAQAHQQAQATFQRLQLVRLVLSEAPAIVAMALAFAVPPSSWFTYAVGAVVAVALVVRHAWPSSRAIEAVVTALEADGTPSGLREVLGVTRPSG